MFKEHTPNHINNEHSYLITVIFNDFFHCKLHLGQQKSFFVQAPM